MSPTLRVLSSLLTTVQDCGRPALGRYGVPVSGAMDAFALAAANRLVGNPPGAAALEISAGGTALELLRPALLALAGADLGAQIDDLPLPPWTAALVRPGACLELPGRRGGWGARAYLALAGGVAVPELLGSRSTCLPGGFGGLDGRPLRPGDVLGTGAPSQDVQRLAGARWPARARPAYGACPALRVIPGPHGDLFAADALARLLDQPFRVGRESNRMGYRLEGAALRSAGAHSLPSLGVVPGALQVPPDGAPILLMADAQPTGGYPIIAAVIGADLPLAAQLLPGDSLSFRRATLEQARAARQALAGWLAADLDPGDEVALMGWAGAGG